MMTRDRAPHPRGRHGKPRHQGSPISAVIGACCALSAAVVITCAGVAMDWFALAPNGFGVGPFTVFLDTIYTDQPHGWSLVVDYRP